MASDDDSTAQKRTAVPAMRAGGRKMSGGKKAGGRKAAVAKKATAKKRIGGKKAAAKKTVGGKMAAPKKVARKADRKAGGKKVAPKKTARRKAASKKAATRRFFINRLPGNSIISPMPGNPTNPPLDEAASSDEEEGSGEGC